MRQSSSGSGSAMAEFGYFLRTGRRVVARAPVEVKFNPYHDPKNGQFTFGPGGGSFGGGGASGSFEPKKGTASRPSGPAAPSAPFKGGGGTFSGGGSSGSWDPLNKHSSAMFHPEAGPTDKAGPEDRAEQRTRVVTVPATPRTETASARPHLHKDTGRTIVRNGYRYDLDEDGRTRQVSGTLKFDSTQRRSRKNQAAAGGSDRLATDDGGHYIATRFGGPSDAFNHFAQNGNFNRGRYRVLEDYWAAEMRLGKKVRVNILPRYERESKRPSMIEVLYTIDRIQYRVEFPNGRSE